jgi:rod shape determining protein RodA
VALKEYWRRFPWLLMMAALALVGLGIAGIYAATARGEAVPFWDSLAGKQVFWLAVAVAVFLLMLVPSYTSLARWSYVLYGASIVVLAVLAFMRWMNWEIKGVIYPTNHAYSWIHIPGTGLGVQPSELTKIAFIMSLAYYLRYRKNFRTFGGLLAPFALALLPTALIFKAADLGTAMLFLPILFLMLFAAGARAKHLLIIFAMGLVMVPVFYSSMKGYQRLRIDSWLLQSCAERMHFALAAPPPEGTDAAANRTPDDEDPAAVAAPVEGASSLALSQVHLTDDQKADLVSEITGMWRFRLWRQATAVSWGKDKDDYRAARDQLFASLAPGKPVQAQFDGLKDFFAYMLDNMGYQLFQAKVAVGAGGAFGRGWLQGTQTKYGILPEAHTDFLFPTLAEQFGFLGAAGIVILFALVCLLGIDVSISTTEPYGRLLAIGVVALLAGQSFLNIAMSIGLMPVTGIPLPLMSYGGSSLLSSFLALGLLANVAIRRLWLIAPRPFEWRE